MDNPKPFEGTMDDFHKIELEKIIGTTQSLYSIRVTGGGIAATITVGILGAAFTKEVTALKGIQAAAGFFMAAGITFGFLLFDLAIKNAIASHYLRALELIKKYSPKDKNALSSIFVFSSSAHEYINGLVTEPKDIRRKSLRFFSLKFPSFIGFGLPLISIIGDIIIGIWFIFRT